MSNWERRLERGRRADRARGGEWLVRRFGGPLLRTIAREIPLALALAVFGYLTVGPAWAVGVFVVLLAVPAVFWWRTHHQVIPRMHRDGEGAPPD